MMRITGNFFSSSLSHLQERNKQSRVVVSQLHFRKNGQCTTYSNSRVLPSPFLLHLPLLPYLYVSSSWSCNKCTSYKCVGTSKNKQTRNKHFFYFSYRFFSSSARKISASSNFSPSLSDGGSLIHCSRSRLAGNTLYHH